MCGPRACSPGREKTIRWWGWSGKVIGESRSVLSLPGKSRGSWVVIVSKLWEVGSVGRVCVDLHK